MSARILHGSVDFIEFPLLASHLSMDMEIDIHGYVVVPDFLEDKGSRMERLIKVQCRNHLPLVVTL